MTNLEQKRWKDQLKWDLPQILTQNLKDLHFELRNQDEDEVIRRRQMRSMGQAFDFSTWSVRLSNSTGVSQKSLEYLFGSWVKDRYLGSILRTIRKDEIGTVQRNPRSYTQAAIEKMHQYPVAPLFTKISNFQCHTPEDNRTYKCGDKMLVVEAQLSPEILCNQENAWSEYRVKFLVRIDAVFGPVIVDVERMQRRIYQTAFLDFEKLKAETPTSSLLTLFSQWTFVSDKEIKEIPAEGLSAMRPATLSAPTGTRMPAATNEK